MIVVVCCWQVLLLLSFFVVVAATAAVVVVVVVVVGVAVGRWLLLLSPVCFRGCLPSEIVVVCRLVFLLLSCCRRRC